MLRHWLRCGVKGWRLDVVDELPDAFLEEFYRVLKGRRPGSGADRRSVGRRLAQGKLRADAPVFAGRRTGLYDELPLSQSVAGIFLRADDSPAHLAGAAIFAGKLHPAPHFYGAMNLVGSHDVPRILTEIG